MSVRNSSSIVKIDDITLLVPQIEILGFSLDSPKPGIVIQQPMIELAGWVLGKTNRVVSIEITSAGQPMNLIRVDLPRPDVAKVYLDTPDTEFCGFDQRIGVVGLPEKFDLVVNAVIKEQNDKRIRVPLAVIHGRILVGTRVLDSTRQPLMVTGLGRSGTTWVMRVLSEIPGIVIPKIYPYEMRVAVYWMHVLKVLSDPADHHFSTEPDGFEVKMRNVGHNPYNHPVFITRFIDPDAMSNVFGVEYLEKLSRFCKSNIDYYYDMIEVSQGQKLCKYFGEKLLPSHIQRVFWSNYSNAKEIIVIRDFRDVVCSAMAFNKRRNSQKFGRNLADSDEQWIRNMRERGVERILRALDERGDKIYLLKYEDFIYMPEKKIYEICEYLNINVNNKDVKNIMERANKKDISLKYHQTSADPKKSIGRWKTDMNENIKDICRKVFGDALVKLGYSLNE